MKIGQSIGLVVFLTLTSLCGAHPSGFAQQTGPAAAAPQANAQPLTYTAGPPPPEFVSDPKQFPTFILWPEGAPGSEKYKGMGENYRMIVSHGYFSVMYEEEHLIFSTLYEAGLRKRELMHLEDSDLISDELVPGCFKTEIRVESKPHWKHQTKTGGDRLVYLPKSLMDRLMAWKTKPRVSKLLFGTSTGNVRRRRGYWKIMAGAEGIAQHYVGASISLAGVRLYPSPPLAA
jgi:integrase